jgi:hypothetical protein
LIDRCEIMQRSVYAPDLGPALSEFDCGRVEFGVGVLTPGFDDLPGEIAGNE